MKHSILHLIFLVIVTTNRCSRIGVQCEFTKLNLNSINDRVDWILENKNGSIKVAGSVPGGVYSDLENAGVIGDVLAGFNDVLTRWVAYDSWSYTTQFIVNEDQLASEVARLVLHGVDTVAYIEVNGSPVGATNNMFVRYNFDIKPNLRVGQNELKLNFASPVEVARLRSKKHFTAPECVPDEYHGECHANQLRKMQASFAWDWGPAFPSIGLWKPVDIEFYTGTVLRSVTTDIKKKDKYWKLHMKVYVESSKRNKSVNVHLAAKLSLANDNSMVVSDVFNISTNSDGTGEISFGMTISENVVSVWWPNGFGDQPLCDLRITLTSLDDHHETSHKQLKVGFRTIEVVEESASLKLGNTTAGKGNLFYFKVNGYPLFMKGSNWIPAHILPERGFNRSTVDGLLTSARDAHMSMLRVWGGGIYETDYFYHRCDELGILIWQDFLFACSMYPADAEFLETVKTEIEQNVIRLQHHASIAVWAGNNENEVALRGNWYHTSNEFERYKQEYIKLYVDTIKPIVEDIDPGRRYLVSSPSNGKKSEEEDYIAQNPYDPHYGDTHYYNYLADNWDSNIYPQSRFASEYGFQSLPSLSTMRAATVKDEDYHVDSEYSKHRQHSPQGYTYITEQINRHLKLSVDDPKHFEKFVFYSQISQAMAMKTETEFYRQSQEDWYTMGALYWQLNDVWQAPSWSGIEYGGKWKILHYFAKSFFAPVLVSPRLLLSGNVEVYLINDRFVSIIEGQMTVDVFNYSSLTPIRSESYPVSAAALSSKKQNVHLSLWNAADKDEIFLRFSLKAEGVPFSPFNYVFPIPLHSVKGLREPRIKITVSNRTQSAHGHGVRFTVDIEVDTIVLFLWLEANAVDGHFDENGFIVTQPRTRVHFHSNRPISPRELEHAITYQYYVN